MDSSTSICCLSPRSHEWNLQQKLLLVAELPLSQGILQYACHRRSVCSGQAPECGVSPGCASVSMGKRFVLFRQDLTRWRKTCWLTALPSRKASNTSRSLIVVTLTTFKWPLLSVVFPRLCLTAFLFCQPFLINAAVELSLTPVDEWTTNSGHGLIGAYVFVYVGIAVRTASAPDIWFMSNKLNFKVSTGQYQHITYRVITMARGGLISMIYSKTTDLSITSVDPAASLTLMSADIERITTGWQTMHEIWANVLEVALAIYLLERQLGAACAIPIAVSIGLLPATFTLCRLWTCSYDFQSHLLDRWPPLAS